MELSVFTSLYNQIQTEPSILFLGQNYLTLGGEPDPVWQLLSEKEYPDIALPRMMPDYPLLWKEMVNSQEDAKNLRDKIKRASQGQFDSSAVKAVKAVANLRWSLFYTSAIVDIPIFENGYTDVPQEEKNGAPKYLNKGRRYRVNLYGDEEKSQTDLSSKKFNHKVKNRIGWIQDYLEYQGVLVIDGLDPDNDWLTDEILFENLVEMRPGSIYWFHAPDHLEEYAAELQADGILITEKEGFYDQMQKHTPELFRNVQDEWDDESSLDDLHLSLTLRIDGQLQRPRSIPRAEVAAINGGNLCILDDSVLQPASPVPFDRAQSFAAFLMQDGIPGWHLFQTPTGQEPFYIRRDMDAELEKRVCTALKETKGKRRPVILEGPSNSGKSAMLANLALTIAKRRVYPVIYIRGDLLPGAANRLYQFIKNWLGTAEAPSGKQPDKILVVWDGNGLKQSVSDYEALQQRLFSQNVQVVGSVYRSLDSDDAIRLDQNLSRNEIKLLKKTLSSLGGDYAERFEALQKRQKNSFFEKNSSMLFWLEEMFKYEFDAEYRGLERLLALQFHRERTYTEEKTAQSLNEYVESFFKAQEIRMREGMAASYQVKLRMLLKEMTEEDAAQTADASVDADARKKEKLQQLSKKIHTLNETIALASEFGVSLPLELLMHLLQENEAGLCVNEDVSKILQVLKNDTLIDYEQRNTDLSGEGYYVRFRSSLEAENCICMRCEQLLGEHSEQRKKQEVEILKRIIRAADKEREIRSVVELIRQFGPNGHGMLSEQQGKRKTDYQEYSSYWNEIAEEAIECLGRDPEIVLVYAHLVREYYVLLDEQQHPTEKSYYREEFDKARSRLQKTLQDMEDHGETEKTQYTRLSVELCANYQQSMQENFNEVYYSEIKRRIGKAVIHERDSQDHSLQRDFSSNYMLDIQLNAYDVYRRNAEKCGTAGADEELVWILGAIDDMLDLETLIREPNRDAIIKKVRNVYAQLGTDDRKMEKLEKELSRKNSDVFLYLQARRLWQCGDQKVPALRSDDWLGMIRADRYLYLLRDIPFTAEVLPPDLIAQVKADARNVIEFLESRQTEMSRMKSSRCTAMLLRARWVLKTGNPMLTEKQRVALTREDWDHIYRDCCQYDSLAKGDPQDAFAPAYFLIGVYQWIYGDSQKSKEYFEKAKRYTEPGSKARNVDRLILCAEGTTRPREFHVNVRRSSGKNCTASFLEELKPLQNNSDKVLCRYGMPVLNDAMEYLFHRELQREEQCSSLKPVIVGFNLIGAQIEDPKNGGECDA